MFSDVGKITHVRFHLETCFQSNRQSNWLVTGFYVYYSTLNTNEIPVLFRTNVNILAPNECILYYQMETENVAVNESQLTNCYSKFTQK